MEVKMLDLNSIIPYENNPRDNKAAIDVVVKSIKEFGFKVPIIIDKDNVIIAGHTRYKAAKKLGMKIIPVLKDENLTPDQVKAFRIMDNKSAEESDWDYKALLKEMDSLRIDDYNLNFTGFELNEIEDLIDKYIPKEVNEDAEFNIDENIERIDSPKTKRGDMWLLGKNKLLCGDCSLKNDVEKLMHNHKAKMVFTDPPYNLNYEGRTQERLTIQNDNMDDAAFYDSLLKVFNNYYSIMDEGAAIYVCHADSKGEIFRRAYRESGFKLAECIIWVKNTFVMGRQDYQWRHEPILYGWKEGKAHYFIDDRTQDTVWEIPKPQRNAEHPTMKPLALCSKAIKNSSRAKDIVVDFFGGSGSTLIAAAETGRIGYLMEIDEKYCDVIVSRYINKYGSSEVVLLRNGDKISYLNVR